MIGTSAPDKEASRGAGTLVERVVVSVVAVEVLAEAAEIPEEVEEYPKEDDAKRRI